MMKATKALALLIAGLANFSASASLVDFGDGTVADTSTNLVWLLDWSSNGQDDWPAQKAWAEDLVFAGSSDWRLPSIGQYATLWTNVGASFSGLSGTFANVAFDSYWSDTDYSGAPTRLAWNFFAGDGFVGFGDKGVLFSAVAVRDAPTANAPEPTTFALSLASLAALAYLRRREHAKRVATSPSSRPHLAS